MTTHTDVFNHTKIPVLDHGYVQFIESWGHGLEGQHYSLDRDPEASADYEVGIIEAARMSTQKGFLGWGPFPCSECSVGTAVWGTGWISSGLPDMTEFDAPVEGMVRCKKCKGTGKVRGDEGLLDYLHTKKHSSPFEFAGMTLEIQAPIMVFREWHRHRTQAYGEMSARYEPLPDVNYVPTVERCLIVNAANKQANAVKGTPELTHAAVLIGLERLRDAYDAAQNAYQWMLDAGFPKEVARLPVPVGRYTRMRATANLRNWLLFMTLRSTLKGPDAQWEIRQFADIAGQIINHVFPKTWSLFCR